MGKIVGKIKTFFACVAAFHARTPPVPIAALIANCIVVYSSGARMMVAKEVLYVLISKHKSITSLKILRFIVVSSG
jgi:hypothetical protein